MSKIHSLILLALALVPLSVPAQTAEEKGLEIAKAADEYDRGFSDFTANMVMTLKNKAGIW